MNICINFHFYTMNTFGASVCGHVRKKKKEVKRKITECDKARPTLRPDNRKTASWGKKRKDREVSDCSPSIPSLCWPGALPCYSDLGRLPRLQGQDGQILRAMEWRHHDENCLHTAHTCRNYIVSPAAIALCLVMTWQNTVRPHFWHP